MGRLGKNPTTGLIVDLFGPTLEFLTSPDDPQNDFCALKTILPPNGFVPCHSHPDTEDFIIISGEGLGIREKPEGGFEWIETKTGDYIHLPGGTPHAWRNVSSEPLVSLVFMTKNLTQFVQDTGRPLTGKPAPPEYFEYFAAIAKKYGHWLATPEENTALGLPPYH